MRSAFLGIDLGTTNSTAAVFDGQLVRLVQNSQGSALTPSVVRIDGRGNVTVGARARRFLDVDPENTRAEFKRLMGTAQAFPFPAASAMRRPQDLAAEVLRAIRGDVRDQLGLDPARAVVAVPALFEVPQSAATAEAARLSGFEEVQLIQEPVASAIAAGWSAGEEGGRWLVYDLGGGTFDVSLLEEREGLLRVVGHDGDNFLGGRDLDRAVVEWALSELRAQGVVLERADPAAAPALRRLKGAAEEARIELSRAREVSLVVPGEVTGGAALELTLDRSTCDRLCAPLIDRSVEVCSRLLEAHRVPAGSLERVVLVGGPTATPALRERVAAALGAPFAEGLDPMTLVAQGAALYAAAAGLTMASPRPPPPQVRRLWLRHPAMSADLSPHLLGRVGDGPGAAPAELLVRREGGGWEAVAAVQPDGTFQLQLALEPRRPNAFALAARDAAGARVEIDPPGFSILHGLTVGDPPLPRSIGVALANDTVREYFGRGAPLPARRTFTQRTVDALVPGSGDALRIPIVQGEHAAAHLCRLVGSLELPADALRAALPAGSEVEISLALDRGGRLSARARVPATEQVFSEVAHLVVAEATPEALGSALDALRARLSSLRGRAFARHAHEVLADVTALEAAFAAAAGEIESARGGDADAAQKASRTLTEAEALLDAAEEELVWPDLQQSVEEELDTASGWVAKYGTETEQKLLAEAVTALVEARKARQADEIERQLRVVRRLHHSAFFRHPRAWEFNLEWAASQVESASDLPAAERLVREGREAVRRGDRDGVRAAAEALFRLLPPDVHERRLAHDSGVR